VIKMDKERLREKLFFGILIAIVAFFVLSFVLVPLTNKSSHWYIVTSGSMEPTLKLGDIIYVSHANAEEIKVGDIISFHNEEYIITHRCVEILQQENKTYFKTKGDANEDADSFLISEDAIIGKIPYTKIFDYKLYAKMPRVGYLSEFVHTKIGFILFILIPSYLLIGFKAYNIFNILQGRDGKIVCPYCKGIFYGVNLEKDVDCPYCGKQILVGK